MPGIATCRHSLRCRNRGERSSPQLHATRRPARLASSHQLMGQGRGFLLARLDAVPLVHRLVADDHLAVILSKSLVELGIAVPGDWKRAECDATSFIRFTLERWIDAHRGPAIRHRFLLPAVIGNTPCNWAERDETKPNQLFLIIEPSEASCGCRSSPPSSAFEFYQGLSTPHPRWVSPVIFLVSVTTPSRYLKHHSISCVLFTACLPSLIGRICSDRW